MIDGASWRMIGEGIGIGAGGTGAALVAAVFGIPALRDGLKQLRELVERVEAALDKLSEGMAAIDKRLVALEVTQTIALALHHGPESLEAVSQGAEAVMHAKDEQESNGEHPLRRAEDRHG